MKHTVPSLMLLLYSIACCKKFQSNCSIGEDFLSNTSNSTNIINTDLVQPDSNSDCEYQTKVKPVIYLLSLLPYYNPEPTLNPSWNAGDDIQPALEFAQDQINNSTLLENYTLQLIYAQEGCSQVARTFVSFVMNVFVPGNTNIAGIIGPGCSASTLGLAPLTSRSNISLVMVHGSGSPELNNRDKYKYLLGTLGSTEIFIQGFLYLLREAHWKRVAILYDDSRPYHRHTADLLTQFLTDENVTIEFSSSVSFQHLPLDVIENGLIRIIYVLCPTELSQQIACLAQQKDMVYDKYQWVYMSQTLGQLNQPVNFKYGNCSDLTKALNGMFLMMYTLVSSPDEMMPISGITYEQYREYYKKYRNRYNMKSNSSKSSENFWATYIYDIVWAWGKVLDNLTRIEGFEISDFENQSYTQKIVEQFYQTKFQGISGEVNFDRQTGFTQRKVNIFQILNESEVHVALIASTREPNKFTEPDQISDSFPTSILQEKYWVGITFNFIIIIQLAVNIGLHILSALNSNQPSIKASSPKLLHMSYIGTYVLVAGTVLYASLISVPEPLIGADIKCLFTLLFWAWFFPVSFTLAFGPVAMRTWRIYRIFKHYLNPGPLISNPILFVGIGLLLCADVTVGTVWTVIDPFKKTELNETLLESVRVKTICSCEYYALWFCLVVTQKLGLLSLVTVLAILTRKIPNRTFTTNALRILTYIMAIIFVLGFSLYYILLENSFDPNNSFATLLALLNLTVAVFIICIFIPPVVPILKIYCEKWRPKCTVDECSFENHKTTHNIN